MTIRPLLGAALTSYRKVRLRSTFGNSASARHTACNKSMMVSSFASRLNTRSDWMRSSARSGHGFKSSNHPLANRRRLQYNYSSSLSSITDFEQRVPIDPFFNRRLETTPGPSNLFEKAQPTPTTSSPAVQVPSLFETTADFNQGLQPPVRPLVPSCPVCSSFLSVILTDIKQKPPSKLFACFSLS